MDSRSRAILAAGVAAGYAVGRSKKEKVALGLLSLATGRAMDPMSLIGQGIRRLAESPQFEQVSESLTSVLERQTRTLLEGGAGGEPEEAARAADADADQAESDTRQETTEAAPPKEAEGPEKADEDEARPSRSARRRPARPARSRSSPHAAGAKNPPAAKAKAMGGKARAERAARRPGPKNPPAAKAKARKAAEEQPRR